MSEVWKDATAPPPLSALREFRVGDTIWYIGTKEITIPLKAIKTLSPEQIRQGIEDASPRMEFLAPYLQAMKWPWEKREKPAFSALEKRRAEFQAKRPRLALVITARDGHFCQDCGKTDDLTLDHIQPMAKGGSDDPSNLQWLCQSCNSKKGIAWTPA